MSDELDRLDQPAGQGAHPVGPHQTTANPRPPRAPRTGHFTNTLIVTVVRVAFQVLIGSMAAYGMILRKGRLTAAVGSLLMVAYCIPMQSTSSPCTGWRPRSTWSTPSRASS
ncbi:hypothetical protein ACWD4O_45095 [Streptomyces sp. NPDC002623]